MRQQHLGTLSSSELRQATHRVIELETALLDPSVRTDRAQVASLLHADFIEHGASGKVWDRAEILDELSSEPANRSPIVARGMRAEVDDHSIIVTYQSITDEQTCQRCSIWVRVIDPADQPTDDLDHGWQIIFHQGTKISSAPTSPQRR